MGKKKVKPNAFSVFMHEYIAKERRAGRHHTKEQWAAVSKPHFDKLTPDQKEAYKQKAKSQPAKVVQVPAKYTSQGVPLEQVEREERELVEKRKYMEKTVNNIVEDSFLENNIATRPFIFMMANYFYKTHDGKYPPAEVAVVKFNFENAIYKSYHTFVNPGTVTIGYAYEAKAHSEQTHRLPPPPDANGEKYYDRVYGKILEVLDVRVGQTFSKDNPKRPSVFVREQDVDMIESVLDQLSDGQWRQTFDVFHLELLFNKLKNKVDTAPGSIPIRITVTNVFIEQDRYDATPNISCDFHEKEDATRHCALSYVTRWFYLFADHICQKIDIKLEPGRHLPVNAALEPPTPFEDDTYDDGYNNGGSFAAGGGEKRVKKDDHDDDAYTAVSSARSGYSKFHNEEDSDSSEDEDY